MQSAQYKRVLLKLSGEALAGEKGLFKIGGEGFKIFGMLCKMVQNRQTFFAFHDIVAALFTDVSFCKIEDIVAYLKTDSYIDRRGDHFA